MLRFHRGEDDHTGSLVLAPPPDRDDGPRPCSAPSAPDPPLEVEHLGSGAQPEPEQKVGREQRDMMTAGTIDLDEIATPEIFDPRRVKSTPRFPEVLEKPPQASAASGGRYVAGAGQLR